SDERTADAALSGFSRFPRWMWRNTAVSDVVDWLRQRNLGLEPDDAAGFYGLDLYSLFSSMEAVVAYLDKVDPSGAERARRRYGCFEHFAQSGDGSQAYGRAAALGLSPGCERDVIAQLVEMRERAAELAARDGLVAADEFFFAEQNARLVANAEEYYRSMFVGEASSWNLRDQHMDETLAALLGHVAHQRGDQAKVVVWAHNSHVGDARATQMGEWGEWNIGQLVRQRCGDDAYLVGFTTYDGTVRAAPAWGLDGERKTVRPALDGSFERMFHERGWDRVLLFPEGGDRCRERAIGVVYRPDTERHSHYFHCQMSRQFDAVIHIDHTNAVEPLDT